MPWERRSRNRKRVPRPASARVHCPCPVRRSCGSAPRARGGLREIALLRQQQLRRRVLLTRQLRGDERNARLIEERREDGRELGRLAAVRADVSQEVARRRVAVRVREQVLVNALLEVL